MLQDKRYILFSRYWIDLGLIGIFPVVSLILLNYGIYTKIRKSTRFRKLHDNNVTTGRLATYRAKQVGIMDNKLEVLASIDMFAEVEWPLGCTYVCLSILT